MINFAADTHRGCVRQHNEDCFQADPEIGLWLVADGVGGHTAGEVASAITIAVTHDSYQQNNDLVAAIRTAHQSVLEEIDKRGGVANMGSTIVALALDGMDYQIAWVGDSRAYLCDEHGQVKLLTKDHSYVESLLAKGAITPEEALQHPKRNVITQSIGISPLSDLQVDVISGTLAANQKILLCSDGLNDELRPEELAELFAQAAPPELQVKELIRAALKAGGRDNVTVLIASTLAPDELNDSSGTTHSLSDLENDKDLLDATIVVASPQLLQYNRQHKASKKVGLILGAIAVVAVALVIFWLI